MAARVQPSESLLRWSALSPGGELGDPLGVELRVLARLGGQLLHCITSVTPRARYYSFFPWCVREYIRRERGKPHDLGLLQASVFRETALALACCAHHDGDTCEGGRIVGIEAARKCVAHPPTPIDLHKIERGSTTAWDQYSSSLRNLGLFDLPHAEDGSTDEADAITPDEMELSPIGIRLAEAFDDSVKGQRLAEEIAIPRRSVSLKSLKAFGECGGICEIRKTVAADRAVLRDLFFNLAGSRGASHPVRRRSLLLIMWLSKSFPSNRFHRSDQVFGDACYFGEAKSKSGCAPIKFPAPLADIRQRWRVFYSHLFFSVAVEGLFKSLVGLTRECGQAGMPLDSLLSELEIVKIKDLGNLLGSKLGARPLDKSALDLLVNMGLSAHNPTALDAAVGLNHPSSERILSDLLRKWPPELDYRRGFWVSFIMLLVVMRRYAAWSESPYGAWLARSVEDIDRDLTLPTFDHWLTQRFDDWWSLPLRSLIPPMALRFLVNLHEWLGYEKSSDNSRIVLDFFDGRLRATGSYEWIGAFNSRFNSAVQILWDLGLCNELDDGSSVLTPEGEQWLSSQLGQEAVP